MGARGHEDTVGSSIPKGYQRVAGGKRGTSDTTGSPTTSFPPAPEGRQRAFCWQAWEDQPVNLAYVTSTSAEALRVKDPNAQ